MIALIRELVNIILSTTTKALSTNIKTQITANMDMNINVDISRGRSALSNSNNSRESSIHSNVFSIPYHIRMKVQSNNSL